MSDIGLFSAFYEQINEAAELLDEVLIALKTGSSQPGDESRQRLSNWLESMASVRSSDFGAQLMTMIMRDANIAPQKWQRLSDALRQGPVEVGTVEELGRLAEAMEQRRAGTMARMRGWTR